MRDFWYGLFKLAPYAVCGLSIYLGYDLFVLGVTGEASLFIEAKSLKARLINATPGLFFAIGGLAALVYLIRKQS